MRIAIAAHKGGAGKTTVAVNLAAALAERGSVLLLDCDPQGAATAALGVSPGGVTMYDVLMGTSSIQDATVETTVPGLWIVPSTLELANAELELPQKPAWQRALRDGDLASLNDDQLTVIIDTAPGLGVLPYVALAAADRVIITCPPEFLSLRSLDHLAATLADVAQTEAPALRVLGIVPTMTTGRTRHEREALDALVESYGSQMLPEIRRRISLQNAAANGQPITVYAPNSDAATAFRELAAEVIRRG